MSKRLIVYYSLSGNTKKAAEYLAEKTGSDLMRLVCKKDVSENSGTRFLIGGMKALKNDRPELMSYDKNIGDYDEIIIGTPIWAGVNAPAVNTFLAEDGIKEKVTGVFTFSGGGDNEKCMTKLRKLIPGLKYSAALADERGKYAGENTARLARLSQEILSGK